MFNLEIQFLRQIFINNCELNFFSIISYFNQWKKSLRKDRSPLNDRKPWMTFQSTKFLEKNLLKGCTVFEYGGGGSTLYFLDKAATVITVEHDEVWFEELNKKIHEGGLSNKWTGLLIKPVIRPNQEDSDTSDPNFYTSIDPEFDTLWFKDYVSSIDTYSDLFFDFVVIDGRSRTSCLKHSIAKVKIGGYLILDNTERDYYLRQTSKYLRSFEVVLDKFGPTPGLPFFTKTTIWRRVD
jgi:hypothetical protein